MLPATRLQAYGRFITVLQTYGFDVPLVHVLMVSILALSTFRATMILSDSKKNMTSMCRQRIFWMTRRLCNGPATNWPSLLSLSQSSAAVRSKTILPSAPAFQHKQLQPQLRYILRKLVMWLQQPVVSGATARSFGPLFDFYSSCSTRHSSVTH